MAWEHTTTTSLSTSQIDEKWNRIKAYPDHPERSLIQRLSQVKASPETAQGRLAYVDRHTWMYEVTTGADGVLTAAGIGGNRWMQFRQGHDAQLTLIHEGVPFPAAYNVNRFLDAANTQRDLFMGDGITTLPPMSTLASLEGTPAEWVARIRTPDNDRAAQIKGSKGEQTGAPFITSIELLDPANSSKQHVSSSYQFSDHIFDEGIGAVLARQIVRHRDDGLDEKWVLTGVHLVSSQAVRGVAAIPSPSGEVELRTLDFTSENTNAWAGHAQFQRAVWRTQDGQDRYELLDSLHGSEISATANTPSATINVTAKPWPLARLIAITSSAIVLIGVPVIAWYWKRKGSGH